MENKVCEWCHKDYVVLRPIKARPQKYCSHECQHWALGAKRKETRVQRVCEQCGKQFEIQPNQLKQKNGGRFCSQVCLSASRVKRVTAICGSCGEEYRVKPSILHKSTGDRHYCSRVCQRKVVCASDELRKYPSTFGKRYRAEIRDRDGHECILCGKPETHRALSVHHIDYNKFNLDPWNLLSLCDKCHVRTNGSRPYWQSRLSSLSMALGYYELGTEFLPLP